MDAAHGARRQLGRLMVEEGFLDQEQLVHALSEQSRTGRPLGEILVELGYVSPGAVANALAEQHGGLLRTEYGVSAGLRPVADPAEKLADEPLPALRAAPGAARAAASGLRVVSSEPALTEPEPDPETVMQAEIELRDNALAELGAAVQARDAELLEARARLAGLEQATAEQPALEEAIREREARIAELAARIEQLEAQQEETERAGFAQLQTALQEKNSELATVTGERDRLAARVDQLEAESASAPSRDAGLPQIQAEFAAQLQEASAKLTALAAERDVLAARAAQLEAEVLAAATHRADNSELELVRAEATSQLRDAATKHAESQAEREMLAAEVARLEAEVAAAAPDRDAATRLTNVQAEAGARLRAAAETLGALTGERDALARRVADLEGKRSGKSRAAADAERSALLGHLDELQVQLERASTERSSLDARLVDAEQELVQRDLRLSAAGSELARVRTEHEVLRATLLQEQAEPEAPRAHLLFVPRSESYELIECDGPPPAPGSVVELDEARFAVLKQGPSPLPERGLVCVYLVRA